MNTKLTLRLEEKLISTAKMYAKKKGKSLSQMVSEYFRTIAKKSPKPSSKKLGVITSQIMGSLKGAKGSNKDYHDYLERKYR